MEVAPEGLHCLRIDGPQGLELECHILDRDTYLSRHARCSLGPGADNFEQLSQGNWGG